MTSLADSMRKARRSAQSESAADAGVCRLVAPYRVVDSGATVNEIYAQINRSAFQGYGPDVRERGGNMGVIVDPLSRYEHLLRALVSMPHVRCVSFRQLLRDGPDPEHVLCAIRHDVDLDIRAAVAEAELERALGIITTYFVLHTGPYYGLFQQGVFQRHECMGHVYRGLQELGHEVALHSDALHVYQQQRIDGASALQTELEWLRRQGITIVGTTAHNSVGVYGAANFAIFKGRPQSFSSAPEDCPSEVVHHGRWSPLAVLDERDLGLEYEANDVFWQRQTAVKYGVAWSANRWWWESEKCLARISLSRSNGDYRSCYMDLEEVLDEISRIQPGEYLVLVVHPEHYGLRASPVGGPPAELARSPKAVNSALGWETYEPWSVQARSGDYEGRQEYQSIHVADERGMLDLPKAGHVGDYKKRILILGGTNLDGSSVCAVAQLQTLLAEILAQEGFGPCAVWKLAFPGMGLARLLPWFEAVAEEIRPHVVLMGFGADEPQRSLPEYWSVLSGWCAQYPPGDFVDVKGQKIQRVSRSGGARIRRRAPRSVDINLSLCANSSSQGSDIESRLHTCLVEFARSVQAAGAQAMLLVDECGESLGCWRETTAHHENSTAVETFGAAVGRVNAGLELPVVDPYIDFLAVAPRRCHWSGTQEWNYLGHRVAARAIAHALAINWRTRDASSS